MRHYCVHCGAPADRHAPETLVCRNGLNTYATMDLPANTTCSNCVHFKRTCEWLIDCRPDRTSCDWFPVRFFRIAAQSPTPPQPEAGTDLREKGAENEV